MTKFDCIVVGAGFAGAAATIRLAQKGVKVLLVERADEAGAKNLSGGILWGDDLARILPDWKAQMPVERPVTNKKIGFLGQAGHSFIIDYHDPSLADETVGFSVLRAKTDPWLVAQCKAAGAEVVTGVNVEGVHKVNGVVKGVRQGGEITEADAVIIADGANSRITLEGDLRHGAQVLDQDHYALGVKEILKMDPAVMEERFGQGKGGMAAEFVVGRDDGVMAGGFLYTNKDTLSLGVVINLATMKDKGALTTHDIVEDFRNHPWVASVTKGCELVEYGAHLVPEGGYLHLGELSGDGFMVVGDAAGFCFSNGIVIQGMNYAVRSGLCAADAFLHAKKRGDYSAVTLESYEKLLEREGTMADFKRFKNVSKFLWNPRLFKSYPDMLAATMKSILGSSGPKMKMRQHLQVGMKEAGISKREMLADAMSAGVNM